MVSINWSNITGLEQLPGQANVASANTFWVGMVYMMFAIMLMMLSYYGFEVALLVSSFVFLVISLIMVYAGLIAWGWSMTFAGIILFTFLYVIYTSSKVRT